MKLQPTPAEDYSRKNDLYVSPFIVVEGDLFNATYGGYNFFSERFSNKNEIFIYLKIDGSVEEVDQDIFIDRTTIEDILHKALLEQDLGCVIGGGTGLKYSYIDFALKELKKSIQVIQKILQQGNLTKKSWFLFHDTVYQSQWIGVWEDSPPPPM